MYKRTSGCMIFTLGSCSWRFIEDEPIFWDFSYRSYHNGPRLLFRWICRYFIMKPYACEPSRLPKYPPNKEIDAKTREESQRKKISRVASRVYGSEATRRPSKTYKPPQEANGTNRLAAHPMLQEESKGSRIQTTSFLLSIGIESPGYCMADNSELDTDYLKAVIWSVRSQLINF